MSLNVEMANRALGRINDDILGKLNFEVVDSEIINIAFVYLLEIKDKLNNFIDTFDSVMENFNNFISNGKRPRLDDDEKLLCENSLHLLKSILETVYYIKANFTEFKNFEDKSSNYLYNLDEMKKNDTLQEVVFYYSLRVNIMSIQLIISSINFYISNLEYEIPQFIKNINRLS